MYQSYAKLKPHLAQSKFRSRFKLDEKMRRYVAEKGFQVLRAQAQKIIQERLAPAFPLHDGAQTPMRGHVVFIAQHATGCCCRSCLAKWHGIAPGHELTADEISYIVEMLLSWIADHAGNLNDFAATPDLFKF